MEVEVVNLDTAKFLKKLGFKEWCGYCYGIGVKYNGEYIGSDEEYSLRCEGKESELEYVDGGILYRINCNNEPEEGKVYAAPTYELASKWLREIHNIHISAMPYYCEDGRMWLSKVYLIEQYKTTDLKLISMVNETYEEAVENGIAKALKYIDTNDK